MKTKSKPEPRPGKPAPAPRETIPAAPAAGSYPVIAMAASVGGLKALSVILAGLPADFPAAIAIVMHLSPTHKSILAEILDSRSQLEVKQAKTGDFLCQSCVFVAPPNHHLFVAKDGRLRLSSSSAEKVHHARPSAEPLFASVAKVYQKDAIAVVLTGGDGDGSFGVQIIKDKGGKVIAQDRPTSQDFSMPETSINTGDVDFILPLNEIAPKLMELVGVGTGVKNCQTTAKRSGQAQTPARRVTSASGSGGPRTAERGGYAAAPGAGPPPSELAAPPGDRGWPRPEGRAPALHPPPPSHLRVTPRYSTGKKAAKVTRKK